MKIIPLILAVITLSACTTDIIVKTNVPADKSNSASVYCHQQGGKLSLIKTKEGTTGYCTLLSGELVEEWALYRRDHN